MGSGPLAGFERPCALRSLVARVEQYRYFPHAGSPQPCYTAGMLPQRPGSAAEVQDIVRQAIAERTPLEAVGGGVHLKRHPVMEPPCLSVSTVGMSRAIDYNPPDLVIVADSGMTLAALQSVLAENRQWLPIVPSLPHLQTLGGIVASRSNSMLRAGYGSVRDWLIGCKVVGGDSELITAGGKVVKNVAGYDLSKLYCGSWGTLGIITECAFKVSPVPEANAAILAVLPTDGNSEDLLDALQAVVLPSYLFLANTDAAYLILGGNSPAAQYVVVGFSGLAEVVDANLATSLVVAARYASTVATLTDSQREKAESQIRDLPLADYPFTARFNILPSQVGAFVRMIEWTAVRAEVDTCVIVADAGNGLVWAHCSVGADDDAKWLPFFGLLRDKADRVGGTFMLEALPRMLFDHEAARWSPQLRDVEWMRAIKKSLDPHNIFRPGRFVGGI